MITAPTIFHALITLAVGILLLLVIAMHPPRAILSRFELKRRANEGDKDAARALHRENLIGDVVALRRVTISVLTVILTLLTISLFDWVIGTVVVIIIVLEEYGLVYRFGWMYRLAQRWYGHLEPKLLRFVAAHPTLFGLIRTRRPAHYDDRIESREQLIHMVDTSGDVLSHDEKRLIKRGLYFSHTTVRSIMVPVDAVETVSRTELLGPLVLNDLHKTEHSRFPVIDRDLDHIVGILHIRDLLTAESGKHSLTAEKAMEPRVLYIHEDQTLMQALAGFLRARHQLFIVVNKEGRTVGLLSLQDVVETLLGRKIIDEYDDHENRTAVAKRK